MPAVFLAFSLLPGIGRARYHLITGTYLFIRVLNFHGFSQLQNFNSEFFPIYGRCKDPWSLVHTFLSHAMGKVLKSTVELLTHTLYIDSTLVHGISHTEDLNWMVLLTVTSKLEILTLCNWFMHGDFFCSSIRARKSHLRREKHCCWLIVHNSWAINQVEWISSLVPGCLFLTSSLDTRLVD